MVKIKNKLSDLTFKKILNNILSFYNNFFGLINLLIGIVLMNYIDNKVIITILIGLVIFDFVRWYKIIIKNMKSKRELVSTVQQNNCLAIYGGIGTGKSTLAQYLLNELVPESKQFTNTNTKGRKIFNSRHLLLLDKLPSGCGVLVDETGRQYDSFYLDKKDDDTRRRLITFNKFFRQFYGSNSYCIYVDQTEANINTAIRRSIFYVIWCKGVDIRFTAFIPSLLFSLIKLIFRKKFKNLNNPFSVVSIEYMEFNALGDFADHYEVNIQDKDHKKLVAPIQKLFGIHNTYVFRKYNPAKKEEFLTWGDNKQVDEFYMESNFQLQKFQDNFDVRGLNIDKYKDIANLKFNSKVVFPEKVKK